MQTDRIRTVLAAAVATALLSPLAWAQSDNAAQAAPQQDQQLPRAPSPPALTDPQRLEDPMSNPPPHSQAGGQVADPSAVARSDKWTQLDADGDGRISATEASADPDFYTHLSVMDADGDGFVSAAEYREFVGTAPMSGDADIDEEQGPRDVEADDEAMDGAIDQTEDAAHDVRDDG